MNLAALDAAITYFQSIGMHTRVDALATLRSQIVLLQAREAELQTWHDAVMRQPTTYICCGKEEIIRPQPLAKE